MTGSDTARTRVVRLLVALGIVLAAAASVATAAPAGATTATAGTNATATTDDGAPTAGVVANWTYRGVLEEVADVAPGPDGGTLIAGTAGGRAVVVRVAPNGTITSTRTFEASPSPTVQALAVAHDGGFAIVGSVGSYAATRPWAVVVDPNGEAAKVDFGPGRDVDPADPADDTRQAVRSVVATPDSGFTLVGETVRGVEANGTAGFLARVDANGTLQRWRTYRDGADRAATDLVRTGDGYLIVGREADKRSRPALGVPSRSRPSAWAMRVDAAGDPSWSTTLRNGTPGVVVPRNDGYAVYGTGPGYGLGGEASGWLLRLAANGTTIGERSLGMDCTLTAASLARGHEDGYLLARDTCSDVYAPNRFGGFVDGLSPSGDRAWHLAMERSNYTAATAVARGDDGRYLVAGTTRRRDGSKLTRLYVLGSDNVPPRPVTGPDHVVDTGERVTLNGTRSSDSDGQVTAYRWTTVDVPPYYRPVGIGPSATISLPSRKPFDATYALTVTDDDGVSRTTTVTLTVPPPIPDVTGDGRSATDPDDDGRYEDVDGDGSLEFQDVVVMLEEFDDSTIQSNTQTFDFDGDGRVSFLDVVTLLEEL